MALSSFLGIGNKSLPSGIGNKSLPSGIGIGILFDLCHLKFSCESRYGLGYMENPHGFHSVPNKLRAASSVFQTNCQLDFLWKSGRIDEARQLFEIMPERDEYTWNTMIAGYANAGRLDEARQIFVGAKKRSTITWNALLSGYCRYGSENESMELFLQMQYEGCKPSQFTLGSVLRMCSINALLSRGEQIHGCAIKTKFDANDFVVTGLVDMYAKCNCMYEAEYLFQNMSSGKNHVTWTAMISAYSQNGDGLRAIECYQEMRAKGVQSNQYTFPTLLTACAAVSNHAFGTQVHGCIVKDGFEANIFVASALVHMYAKCGDLSSARTVLETMGVDDVISWNSLIAGCMTQGMEQEALIIFKEMHNKNMQIDEFTFPSVLNSFASIKDVENAKSVHCLIVKIGLEGYILVSNALIDMYAKLGDLTCAFDVFNHTEDKDVISWTSLITGYAHKDCYEEALKLFCKMRVASIKPDLVVTASVLSSCAELTVLEFGQQVHGNFVKSCLGSSLSVDNSLIKLYAKCGCLEDANRVFNLMQNRNVITWTALIIGYAQNGKGEESLQLYNEMIASGIKPDFITFIGLLYACSHAGLVERGRQFFDSMDKVYGIKPGPDHYASMIDMLGRAGKMQEARNLLNEMEVEPDATVWKALLAACRVHGDIELAETAAKALFELEPQDAVSYVMLSNMHSAAGKWEDAARVRKLMKSRSATKEPGCSWISINGQVHTFVSEDRKHPKTDQIYVKLDEVIKLIKRDGYVPDTNFALHDINEEAKEHGLSYHSEKLAVAFGLLVLPQVVPIRVFKNLRVCGDCHSAMKHISSVFNRHIVLRDSNRFHHLKEGMCSCGDYW